MMPQTATPAYSPLFSCLYDEPAPIGKIGRGTHYSVFRCVEPRDVDRNRLDKPQIHDFAVIWDEDHDTRVISVVEQLYMENLLSPVQFIGERKGSLTVLVAARFFWSAKPEEFEKWKAKVEEIANNGFHDDYWPLEVGSFDRRLGSPHQTDFASIIQDDANRVGVYLRNIDNLWRLGTRVFTRADSYSGPEREDPEALRKALAEWGAEEMEPARPTTPQQPAPPLWKAALGDGPRPGVDDPQIPRQVDVRTKRSRR
ncbi:hypothetical protein D9M68_223140 [compost metagenome]